MITDPVGIDYPIQALQSQFTAHLFAGKTYTAYGRAFLNERNGTVPEVYLSSNEYQEVLQDDTLDALSFFTVEPEEDITMYDAKAKVKIYFFVNLASLFTYTHRAVEEVHKLVLKEINNSPFQVTRLVTGHESVKDFAIERPELMDMQPYYCFRFECLITYKLC
jgi:hypothetical protein